MSYREETTSTGSSVLRPEAGLTLFRPRWYVDNKALTSIVRPIGPTTPDGKAFLPWRYGPEARAYTDWIEPAHVWFGGTKTKVELLLKQYNADGSLRDRRLDPNPFYRLYSVLRQRQADRPDWAALLTRRGRNQPPAFPAPSLTAFVQGFVFFTGPAAVLQKLRLPTRPKAKSVMSFRSTARLELQAKLDEMAPGHETSDDINEQFVVGDILHPKHGKMFLFAPEFAGQDTDQASSGVDFSAGRFDDDDESGGRKAVTEGYGVDIKPAPLPVLDDGRIEIATLSPFVPWKQAFNFMTDAQIAEALCTAFGDSHKNKELLYLAFQDIPDVVGARRWSWLTSVTAVQPPAARPPEASPPQPAEAPKAAPRAEEPPGVDANFFRGAETQEPDTEAEVKTPLPPFSAPPGQVPDAGTAVSPEAPRSHGDALAKLKAAADRKAKR